jgi:hypothetical protein
MLFTLEHLPSQEHILFKRKQGVLDGEKIKRQDFMENGITGQRNVPRMRNTADKAPLPEPSGRAEAYSLQKVQK